MPEFGFIGPGYPSRGKVGEIERWLNMYLEPIESGMGAARPTRFQAFPTPGKAVLIELPTGPIAAVEPTQNPDVGPSSGPLFFAVGADQVYAVSVDTSVNPPVGTAALVGAIDQVVIPGTGGQLYPVSIVVLSPLQLMLLTNTGNLWIAAYGAAITGSSVHAGGVGYAVGDTGAVLGGLITAVYTVTGVGGSGDVTSFTLAGGTGYLHDDYQTETGGPQPGTGSGFVVRTSSIAAPTWLVTLIQGSPLAPALKAAAFVGSITFLDGYMIAGLTSNDVGQFRRTFFFSQLNQPDRWNALDFDVKEANPDGIVAVYAAYEILLVFGTQTTELWQNIGSGLSPFQRLPGGGVIEVGLASVSTIAKGGGAVVWLAIDARGQYSVWQMQGSTPQRVSNHALENQWSNFNMNGANLYSYQEQGHIFFVLNIPVADKTFVYDMALGPGIGWHERATWDGSTFHADLARYHGFTNSLISGYGLHVVGDYSSANLYLQGMQFLNENCNPIRRIRVCPHLVDEKKMRFYTRFRLHCLTGVVDPTLNPICSLRISNDGGQTWGSYLDMPMGTTGAYEQVMDWLHLGRSKDRVFEWSSSADIDFVLVEAYLESFTGSS